MPLPQLSFDDRALALAKARQQFAHDCTFPLMWDDKLSDKEREGSLSDACDYVESAVNAGLIPAVD